MKPIRLRPFDPLDSVNPCSRAAFDRMLRHAGALCGRSTHGLRRERGPHGTWGVERRWDTHYAIAFLLLLALFAQLIFSAGQKSATMDEPFHIFNGVLWFTPNWQRAFGCSVSAFMGNPPLVNVLQALPLVALDDVRLPTDTSAWEVTSWRDLLYGLVYPFLWQINGERALRFVFLARLPVIGLALLLAAGVYRWASELYSPTAGLLALLLATFEPNLLAHGRLATSDLGAACCTLWATYLYWRYTRHPGSWRLIAAGVVLGLALASKFSAVLLLLAFALLSLWPAPSWREEGWLVRFWRSLAGLLGIAGIAAFILLASFRFDVGALWAEYDFQREHFQAGHAAFLMGRYSGHGWWYYFPVAFALKTPLPLMVLAVGGAIGCSVSARSHTFRAGYHPARDLAFLLLPPTILGGASLFSRVNIGYRYLLPVLPFLLVLASGVVCQDDRNADQVMRAPRPRGPCPARVTRWTFTRMWSHVRVGIRALLVGWFVLGSLRTYPHYLAYFNELTGGPDGGWRYLVDSNLDWGQDLPGLRAYMGSRGLNWVYLSWFGTASPERYGVKGVPLPSTFPSPEEAAHRVYHPQRPLPGTYAISATHLQGVYLSDRDTYAWFRAREPTAKIGYSIFVYDVPHVGGDPVSVGLSGVSLDQVDVETMDAALRTNDLHLRWFDVQSLVLPASGWDSWFLVNDDRPLDPALEGRFLGRETIWGRRQTTKGGSLYTLYHLAGEAVGRLSVPTPSGEMPVWWSPAMRFPPGYERQALSPPVRVDSHLAFQGYELSADRLTPGDTVQLLTFWRVEQPFDPPLALFVHLLDAEGQVRGQHDGLSVDPVGLEAGDVLVQVHSFAVPTDAPCGEYPLEVGVYRPDTMQRWDVYQGDEVIADRLLLKAVHVLPGE